MLNLLRRLIVGSPQSPQPVEHAPIVPDLPSILIRPSRLDAALEVVGESYRQNALERIGGGRTEDGAANPDQIAILIPDTTNPYDSNAVAVMAGGLHVGYLSRTDAEQWSPLVQWEMARGLLIATEAALIGGWDRGRGDRGSFGIVLHLGTASETLVDLLADELSFRPDHPWQANLIAFTGDSTYRLHGFAIDRGAAAALASRAGMQVHPRVTKKVQLLVDCDATGVSGNQAKADEYGIPVVAEGDFWKAIGLPVEQISWQGARRGTSRGGFSR